ncbi:anti-sigma factor [Candidatus Leptofilum sp.]|uniref:anti-sigma factor n=1 Tax=Candidatus Leptofilum sp. TaxID=3241576 RepID=UPI003B5BD73D
MNRQIEEELFPFYALGALTDEEKAEVEAYIAADPEAKARLAALQETAASLPNAVEPVAPSPNIKANLMARVQADPRAATVPTPKPVVKRPSPPQLSWWDKFRQSFAMPALAGTAALAAVLLFVWAISLSQQLNQLQNQVADLTLETDSLQTELGTLQLDNNQLQIQNDLLQQQLQAQEEILAAYQQPGTSTIAIGDITGEHPTAHATLTVAPEATTATFVTANLPQLGADQVYQLWIIQGDLPMSAGIFNVDEDGRIVHQIDGALAASFDAIGVSIEPAGGSDQPTPDQIILLGSPSS